MSTGPGWGEGHEAMTQEHKSRVPSKMIARAREIRHAMTPAEEIFCKRLRNRGLGVKFRRQVTSTTPHRLIYR